MYPWPIWLLIVDRLLTTFGKASRMVEATAPIAEVQRDITLMKQHASDQEGVYGMLSQLAVKELDRHQTALDTLKDIGFTTAVLTLKDMDYAPEFEVLSFLRDGDEASHDTPR